MNKQNQNLGSASDSISPEKLTETIQHPEFGPGQLPELWKQVGEPSNLTYKLVNAWNNGLDTMLQRCETYPQHAKLVSVLCSMPDDAWFYISNSTDGDDLLQQATPEQLVQALKHEQQHAGKSWRISGDILEHVTAGQLTGPVIEQLQWRDNLVGEVELGFLGIVGPVWDDENVQRQHITEHIQQNLLEGNNHAWTMFLGIVNNGTITGDAARIANAIEQGNNQTSRTA